MFEYIGYAASVIVLVSILMSSVKKLRWINLLGSITFSVYGFLIGSMPVALLNVATTAINIYYLTKMYNTKDYFKFLDFDIRSEYFHYFLEFYKKDLLNFFSPKNINLEKADMSFYILRNLRPAGIFVGNKIADDTLKIEMDYVVPEYRDFQMGNYLYHNEDVFIKKGYKKLVTYTNILKHEKYLEKMGFRKTEIIENDKTLFEKVL